MFIADLFEQAQSNLVVVYPGRFQPFHKGHKAVYDFLNKKYGRDHVWIATSNKTDNLKSPFSFGDKIQFMAATGVSADRVVESTQPYRPAELLGKFNPENTIVIFAVSQKDMEEDPRFTFTKKDGSPAHFQPLPKDLNECLPFAQHSYIEVVPTFDFAVLGQPMRSASEVRAQYKAADDTTKQAIIKDLFGSYSSELKHILDTKLAEDTVNEHIVKTGNKYRLVSKHGNKNLGTYDTRAGAEKRERQVQYFKHADESVNESTVENAQQAAWATGYQAFHTDVTKCPYAPGSVEARQWNLGWESAQARGWNKEGVAEGKEDKIKQLMQDHATAVYWSKNDTNSFKRESARLKAEKIKRHLETQYKRSVAEDAAGVGVVATNKKMAKDPRYSTSITVDVHPDTPTKNLKAFNLISKGNK